MKYLKLIMFIVLLAGCASNNVEIDGTVYNANGGIATVIDPLGKSLFNTVIKADKFAIKQLTIPEKGYYVLSIQSGNYPREFDIYLEPGKYVINVPQQENEYLHIKTSSTTQQSLTAYYNLENSMSKKIRAENAVWLAKIKDPKTELLSETAFKALMAHVDAGRRREHGLHIAAIDSFIKAYPLSTVTPHIISNMNYKSDPAAYLMLYNKLGTEAQNTPEGKLLRNELKAYAQ